MAVSAHIVIMSIQLERGMIRVISVCVLCLCCFHLTAGTVNLSSQRAAGAAPAGASGDSAAPILSGDGRYVLFASVAADVVSNGIASTGPFSSFNVYMRDRVTGQTTLVSVNASNTAPANGDSTPIAFSADNRYVLFESLASDLVAGDTNNAADIFVRDLTLGSTRLVSANVNGVAGNGASRSSTMTPDGRYVAFVSKASDLVVGDTNNMDDVFVRDLQLGTTVRASIGATPSDPNSRCEDPVLSSDGRYVAFFAMATNLTAPAGGVTGNNVPGDIYVRDLIGGQTICASTNARPLIGGSLSAVPCLNHAMSSDGQWVAFSCTGFVFRASVPALATTVVNSNALSEPSDKIARSLDMTPDGRYVAFLGSAGTNVLRWDAQTSITFTSPVSAICFDPQLDPTGRYLFFFGNAIGSGASTGNLYRWDTQTGATNIMNVDAFNTPIPITTLAAASVSSNAQVVAFDCQDTLLATNDNNHAYDVLVRDLVFGTNQLISLHDPGLLGASANAYSALSSFSISSNGQFLGFLSIADNLVANDTNPVGYYRAFFRDMAADTNLLASSAVAGMALEPAVSANGRYVAFTARGTNTVDVYIYDTQSGTTALVSASTNGSGHSLTADASSAPSVSADGHYVLFQSYALDLAPGVTVRTNYFLRDVLAGTTRALTTNGWMSSVAAMTPDAHFVALAFSAGISKLLVFDTQLGKYVSTNSATSVGALAISGDGNRLAYASNSVLSLIDRTLNTNRQVATFFSAKRPGIKLNADGSYLAYATKPSLGATNTDVWIYNFAANSNSLVSRSFLTGASAGGTSDSPDLTSDGRYVAFRSDSRSIAPGDNNGLPDIYLYDRVANQTSLVSANSTGNAYGNGRSLTPVFSADSRSLLFGSWAGNLVNSDFNQGADLFLDGFVPPPIVDSDGDGMDDAWEMKYFGTLARDGTGDFDGDGVSDLEEFLTGTDPTDPMSYFHLDVASASPNQSPILSWPAVSSKSYRLQFKNALSDTNWQDSGAAIVFIGNKGYCSDPLGISAQRFYRLVLVISN